MQAKVGVSTAVCVAVLLMAWSFAFPGMYGMAKLGVLASATCGVWLRPKPLVGLPYMDGSLSSWGALRSASKRWVQTSSIHTLSRSKVASAWSGKQSAPQKCFNLTKAVVQQSRCPLKPCSNEHSGHHTWGGKHAYQQAVLRPWAVIGHNNSKLHRTADC